ncbi:MAG: hypothetical protein JNK65_07620, partial [Deltaproteobacteria bacterium]|nr:hypothetical protein [Deltaproteobacteria bacterium]
MNSKNKKVAGLFLSLVFCAGMWSCSGSGIETASNNPLPNNPSNPGSSVPQSPKLESLTKNAFLIGSAYPADIDIIDQPGLEDVAFITTSSTPPVIAVDLNSNPLKLSTSFKGLQNLPPSAGYPNNLWVVDATHALLLTSSSLILF